MTGSPAPHARDRVLFITDLHFWEVVWNPLALLNKRLLGNANVLLRRRHHFPMAHARPFARHALATGARTILCGGDLTSTATEGEFRRAVEFLRFLESEGAELLLVPGNHDVYTFEALRKQRFERHAAPWLPREGYPARRELPGGTEVLLLSTVCPNLLSSRGRISERALEAVRELCAAGGDEPLLVVGHYPLLHRTAGYELTPGRRMRGAEALRRALGAARREVLYLAGHVHWFSYTRDPDYANLCQVTGPALFCHWAPAGREGGFVELACRTDGFDVRHHWKEREWTSEVALPAAE